jgi:hypothetical protein
MRVTQRLQRFIDILYTIGYESEANVVQFWFDCGSDNLHSRIDSISLETFRKFKSDLADQLCVVHPRQIDANNAVRDFLREFEKSLEPVAA